jgi:hypothetical protein
MEAGGTKQNAICLDIGEKIGRRSDAVHVLKKLGEAAPVGDQLWTFYDGLIA